MNDIQPFSWLQNFNLFLLQEKLFSTTYLKIPLYSDTSVWTSFTLEKETWQKRITDFLLQRRISPHKQSWNSILLGRLGAQYLLLIEKSAEKLLGWDIRRGWDSGFVVLLRVDASSHKTFCSHNGINDGSGFYGSPHYFYRIHICMLNCFSCVWLFATLWTIACQAPLSMGFSNHEYWSGLPCLPAGDLPNPEIKPTSLMSLALTSGFFTTSTTWEALYRVKWKWKSLRDVKLFVIPWTIQSMGFSRPEYWGGGHSLLQGIFPAQGLNPGLQVTPSYFSFCCHLFAIPLDRAIISLVENLQKFSPTSGYRILKWTGPR